MLIYCTPLSSDVHVESPCLELVVNNVLHDMVLFLLAEIEQGIAQAYVREVIFKRRINV